MEFLRVQKWWLPPRPVIETSSATVILDNKGVLEGSKMVAPSKNMIGKKKGTKDQGDSSKKHVPPQMLNVNMSNLVVLTHSGILRCRSVVKTGGHGASYFSCRIVEETYCPNSAVRTAGNRGLQEVLANDKGFFFVKFSVDEACSNVLESGPWLFAGRMMILKKWHARLILTKENCSKIPVWVKLFNIPHEYWNEEGLCHIASMVGKPLYTDSLTESVKKISYARVCIEIDDICELVDSFDLFMGDNSGPNIGNSVEILVEYQWKPKICIECKSFGHSITTCPKVKPLHPSSVMDFDPKPKQEWRRVTKGVAIQIPLPHMNLEPLPFDEVISAVNSKIEPSLCPTNLPIKIQCNVLSKESVVDISNKFSALDENGINVPSKESVIDCSVDDSPTIASPDHSLWLSRIKNIDGVPIIGLSSPPKSSSNNNNKKKWTTKKGKDNSSQAKIVLGDFNVSRRVNESVGGSSRISLAMEEFNDCLQASDLDDLRFSGFLHTWCNMRSSGCISKKLDSVLVNKEWMARFKHSESIFLPYSISDHSPSFVKLG
ncbi:hypothetical protein Dsin_024685 [Dipteronia sinensis]|uniref:DUF4283 domain-containing protein n=1 Tax=Dipteronia sinensis TaxID=43782 RepID=A0AAD9ZUG3_9ROSI|nr:hypothetical protein Dsin_024685 [Dipteronia sinensis]